jgi:phosphoglycolate phosphatase
MYKAVLFDMDGTVLNTVEDLTDAMNHSLNKFGFPSRTIEEVKSFLGKGPTHFVNCAVPEGTDEATRRTLQAYNEEYYDTHCQIKTAPYPGIMELLGALRQQGIKLAVISNKQDPAVQALAQQHFNGLMELAVGTGPDVACKPNPAAVLKAMEQLNVTKAETVYVGDMDVDMNTAKNAGIDCICVAWGFMGRKKLESLGAKLIVDNTDELFKEITK